jgi:hypothetical protein
MFLNNTGAVIGIFLLGAASGACLKYARYRGLVALCNQLLAEAGSMEEGSTSSITRGELPVRSKAEFPDNELKWVR